jgi:hypothetical protein
MKIDLVIGFVWVNLRKIGFKEQYMQVLVYAHFENNSSCFGVKI